MSRGARGHGGSGSAISAFWLWISACSAVWLFWLVDSTISALGSACSAVLARSCFGLTSTQAASGFGCCSGMALALAVALALAQALALALALARQSQSIVTKPK